LKQSLEKAQSSFVKFRATVMQTRKEHHEQLMQVFIGKKGQELQQKIFSEAKSELTKVQNIRKVQEKQEKDKKQMKEREVKEREAKARAEGRSTPVDDDNATGGWVRGSAQQPEMVSRSAPRGDKEDSSALSRGNMGVGKPAEEKKDDGPKRPIFNKQVKKDDGGMSRAGFGQSTSAKEESKS